MADTAMKYFSTNLSVMIQGKKYVPSVCYPLEGHLEPAVQKMVERGEATMYLDKVRFVNGRPLEIKKPLPPNVQTSFSSVNKQPNKKGGRTFN